MSDVISLTGIWGFGYHGVFDHEAKNGQDFFVDLEIHLDLSRASVSDDLTDTIDYGALADIVVSRSIKTIQGFDEAIRKAINANDKTRQSDLIAQKAQLQDAIKAGLVDQNGNKIGGTQ